MTCKNCGMQIPKNETKCPKCGTDNSAEETTFSAPAVESVVPKGFSAKKNIIIIIIATLIALGVGGTAAAVGISNAPANRVSRYMGAAERYLSEMNYEQAIIEFQRILEIDPMNADAYLGMVEAYIALGDIDNAIETLRTGLEQTGDDRIREKLNELLLSLALERGNTYLSEEKYSQAESEFADALDIDERCVEAYIGKADSHIGTENIDKAIEVLQTGFDITGDSVIKEKLDVLIEEQSKPKLLWSNVDGNVVYANFGHYVKLNNDLWQPCDEGGTPVTDKAYKFIEHFCGTDEANYTVVTTEEGRVVCLDKNLTEIFELREHDHYAICNPESPVILTWHASDYNDPVNDYLRIYSPDGNVLFKWNKNESLDGSGNSANIDDPTVPDELRQFIVDKEAGEQRDYWCKELNVAFGAVAEKSINSKVYFSFQFDCTYDYDDSAERAEYEAKRQHDLQEYGFTGVSYNRSLPSQSVLVIYCISLEDGKIKWEKISEDNSQMPVYIAHEGDDYRILCRLSAFADIGYVLKKEGETERTLSLFRFKGYDPDFPLLFDFIDDKHMILFKNKDDGSDENVYALYRICWEESGASSGDSKTRDEVYAEIIELNKKHERVTDFYDDFWWNDVMLEMGYLLVCKEDKWIFVSIETGDELAIYDDASYFSNGYAVVTNNGKGCIIDKDFNVVSDEFPCESTHVLGDGSFIVTTGSETKRLVIN